MNDTSLNMVIVSITPILIGILAMLIRKGLKAGVFGFEQQVKAHVKDHKTRKIILGVIEEINKLITSEGTEKKIRKAVSILKGRIPGKLDDIVLEAIVKAIYDELDK